MLIIIINRIKIWNYKQAHCANHCTVRNYQIENFIAIFLKYWDRLYIVYRINLVKGLISYPSLPFKVNGFIH